MVASVEEIEAYLAKLDRHYERLDNGTLLVAVGANQPPVAVRVAEPVVVLQVAIGPAPKGTGESAAKVYRRLLELNAHDLLHAAYGVEAYGSDPGRIVLSAALELRNLDLNELEAVLADIDMALSKHVPELHQLVQLVQKEA